MPLANARKLKARVNNFMLTTALNTVPFFILPLFEKIGLAQWRMVFMLSIGLMMLGIMFQVLFVSIIA